MKKILLNLSSKFSPRFNNELELVLFKRQESPKLKIVAVSFVAGFFAKAILTQLIKNTEESRNNLMIDQDFDQQQDRDLIA